MTYALPVTLADGARAVVTRELDKRYGAQSALRAVNLQVPVGAFYLLVGPNGAGKSTMLKVLLDLVRATGGSAEVLGLDVQAEGSTVRANIGYVPEQSAWGYGWMTVSRMLAHHSCYFPSWDTAYAERLAHVFDVRAHQSMRTLSKGQARRVHLIMALAHRPPLLLLDEPTDGLDPVMRDETLGVLAEHLAETETTVLFSTHHVTEIEKFADHVGVLRGGELRAQLPLTALHEQLRRYRAQLPDVWHNTLANSGTILKRSAPGREMEWTIWGREENVTAEFTRAGATVHQILPLSLDEATLALLSSNG